MIRIDGKPAVWVFLVERGLNDGSDLQLFWHEAAAIDAARAHLSASWPPEELATQADVLEAIEAANQLVGDEEYIVLAPFPIEVPNPKPWYLVCRRDRAHDPRVVAFREWLREELATDR